MYLWIGVHLSPHQSRGRWIWKQTPRPGYLCGYYLELPRTDILNLRFKLKPWWCVGPRCDDTSVVEHYPNYWIRTRLHRQHSVDISKMGGSHINSKATVTVPISQSMAQQNSWSEYRPTALTYTRSCVEYMWHAVWCMNACSSTSVEVLNEMEKKCWYTRASQCLP